LLPLNHCILLIAGFAPRLSQPFFAAAFVAFFSFFNSANSYGFADSSFCKTSVSASGARLKGFPPRPAGLGTSLAVWCSSSLSLLFRCHPAKFVSE